MKAISYLLKAEYWLNHSTIKNQRDLYDPEHFIRLKRQTKNYSWKQI